MWRRDFNCSRELKLLSHQAVIQIKILQCKYVRYIISCFTSFQMLSCFISFTLRCFFCVCVMKEKETEIERQTWRKWGCFLVERHAAGSRLLSPCPMPLECSFVVWTPIRPLFVLRRWGLAECDRALTPEAIRGGGNNTFIPYGASALIPPNVPGHKQAKRSSWMCCTPSHECKETNCQSTAVQKAKYKPACADT